MAKRAARPAKKRIRRPRKRVPPSQPVDYRAARNLVAGVLNAARRELSSSLPNVRRDAQIWWNSDKCDWWCRMIDIDVAAAREALSNQGVLLTMEEAKKLPRC